MISSKKEKDDFFFEKLTFFYFYNFNVILEYFNAFKRMNEISGKIPLLKSMWIIFVMP